eukprot:jgi/Psemu1/25503/gm1.25503_g
MSIYDPDLSPLFPSFDSNLAHVLNATLNVPREACNHICEVLIIAGTDLRSTNAKDQHTLTSFVDFINDIMLQDGCYWYDHNQYTRDAFLAFCNARNQHPELTVVPTKANAAAIYYFPSESDSLRV